jgi:coatomer protein complex subunit epsilon
MLKASTLTSPVTELYQIRSYFYQGNYTAVLNEPIGSLSRSDLAQIYQYRSRIELGQASQVVEEMGQAGSTGGGFDAIKVFAEYRSGDKQRAVEDMVELIQADPEDDVVQVIGATVLSLEGRTDEALELLSKHENSLEAYGVD